jgi:hypothetical protein
MEKSMDKEDRKKIGKNSKVYDVSMKEKRQDGPRDVFSILTNH